MRISIEGVDIEVMWSVNPDSTASHFYLAAHGPNESTTRAALASVVDMLTRHREVFWRWRQTPCEFFRDFETGTVWWQSRARFTVTGHGGNSGSSDGPPHSGSGDTGSSDGSAV
jgi:hypothetical protein